MKSNKRFNTLRSRSGSESKKYSFKGKYAYSYINNPGVYKSMHPWDVYERSYILLLLDKSKIFAHTHSWVGGPKK